MKVTLVTCVCGQKNRVPDLDPGQSARCGKCRAPLSVSPFEDDEDEDDEEDDE